MGVDVALNRKGGPWAGGYVSLGARGQKTYVIERMVQGVRFHVSTRAHDERAALRHLDRFESNPSAYRPVGDESQKVWRASKEDVLRYVRWSCATKGNTRKHALETGRYLFDWLEDLGAADWRRLKVSQLHAALEKRKTSRGYRIAAIKAFFTWLVKVENLVTSEHNATRDLASVQASPEKMRREKKVSKETVTALLAKLGPVARDFVLVKAGTGLHNTEIHRVIRGENASFEQLDELTARRTGALAVIRFLHKNGKMVVKRIETEQLRDALQRLIAVRVVDDRDVNDAIRAACTELELPDFTLGVLRHSWGSWLVEAGVSPEVVAQGYGHQSKKTSERFYIQVAVPNATVPPTTFDVPETVH